MKNHRLILSVPCKRMKRSEHTNELNVIVPVIGCDSENR